LTVTKPLEFPTMKRLIAGAAGLLLALAAGAAAEAAEINVAIGPELQQNSKSYGAREVQDLADDLRDAVGRALAKPGAAQPQRIDLVLEAATPNRPTFQQMSALTGLSLRSVGLGGAAVTGTVTQADGSTQPLSYRWYETDLRNVIGYTTWTDAGRTFSRLATQIAAGKTPNQGPYRPDLASRPAFSLYR
jgi:hypothetical protein